MWATQVRGHFVVEDIHHSRELGIGVEMLVVENGNTEFGLCQQPCDQYLAG
jgi:hypothetical protein